MPSSLQRHRIEIDHRLYSQLHELATREGYPVSRFVDKLLFLAVQDYIGMRRIGRYPFAGDGLHELGGRGGRDEWSVMQVNFNRDEYDLIKELADYYHTKPAPLVHDWIMERIGIEFAALKEARERSGSRDGGGFTLPHPKIQSSPASGKWSQRPWVCA